MLVHVFLFVLFCVVCWCDYDPKHRFGLVILWAILWVCQCKHLSRFCKQLKSSCSGLNCFDGELWIFSALVVLELHLTVISTRVRQAEQRTLVAEKDFLSMGLFCTIANTITPLCTWFLVRENFALLWNICNLSESGDSFVHAQFVETWWILLGSLCVWYFFVVAVNTVPKLIPTIFS